MNKNLIKQQGHNKYYKTDLPRDFLERENANFTKLLMFIGENLPYDNRDTIGSAYKQIRLKTDEIMGFSKKNIVLKTSKREVVSIRKYFEYKIKNEEHADYYVKIPYKISYIFQAIICLLIEIYNKNIPLSQELQSMVGNTYLRLFYNNHYQAYLNTYNDIPQDAYAQRALHDDFKGAFSSLNNIFH